MNDIINLYEVSVKILTPKSYQWKAVAEQMYKIAKGDKEWHKPCDKTSQ